MEKTYYEKFKLKETATLYEIKRAYIKLAMKYHPDKHGGDKEFENVFKEINRIYQILSDPDKRKAYNLELRSQREGYNYQDAYYHTTSAKPSRVSDFLDEFIALFDYRVFTYFPHLIIFILILIPLKSVFEIPEKFSLVNLFSSLAKNLTLSEIAYSKTITNDSTHAIYYDRRTIVGFQDKDSIRKNK